MNLCGECAQVEIKTTKVGILSTPSIWPVHDNILSRKFYCSYLKSAVSSFVVIYPAYESASVSSRQHGSLLSRYCQNETASECSLKVIIIAKSFIFVFRDPQNRHPEC